MNQSEQINELSKALCTAQSQMTFAKKDSKNPFFKSSYADLSSVWEACREPLTKNGLAVIQTFDSDHDENTVIVVTTLTHSSGQWINSRLKLPLVKKDPQGLGSAITYGRRYSLAAIVGVIADEDDDGNAATHGKAQGATPAPKKGNQAKLTAPVVDPVAIFDIIQDIKSLDELADHYEKRREAIANAANKAEINALYAERKAQIKETT